jgi:hypothetical protein
MSNTSLSLGGIEIRDEPVQLRILADATEDRLRRVQEEKEKATEALKKEKKESLEQSRVAKQEKDDL